MHALIKCLECSGDATFAKQGLGSNSCLQLPYIVVTVHNRIKQEGGIELLDEIRAMVVDELVNNENWQREAAENCVLAADSLFELLSSEAFEDIEQAMKGERNLQMPVWTRWMTVLKAVALLKEKWTIFYFTLVAVKQSKKVSSYLAQTAIDGLKMMRTKVKRVDAATASAVDDGNMHVIDKSKECPVFYAQLCLLDGFAKSFFNNAFEVAMRNDPEFGPASHGQTARLTVILCYLWKKQLTDLADVTSDMSWTKREEFADYRASIENMPSLGEVGRGGREWFDHAPVCLLNEFTATYGKLVEKRWRSNKILVYLIGCSSPRILQLFLLKKLAGTWKRSHSHQN